MQMTPYLSFKGGCEAAFKFYEQSLGGQLGAMFRYAGTPMVDRSTAKNPISLRKDDAVTREVAAQGRAIV